MKYAVDMGSGAMTYIPSFIQIGSGIQTLIHRQPARKSHKRTSGKWAKNSVRKIRRKKPHGRPEGIWKCCGLPGSDIVQSGYERFREMLAQSPRWMGTSTLMTDAAYSSEILVLTYHTAWYHNPEHNKHLHCLENSKT
jgi:hypothetical protein